METYEVPLNIRISREMEAQLHIYQKYHRFKNRTDAVRHALDETLTSIVTKEELEQKIEDLENDGNEIQLQSESQLERMRERHEIEEKRLQVDSQNQKREIGKRKRILEQCLETGKFFQPHHENWCFEQILAYPFLWKNRSNSVWLKAPSGDNAFSKLKLTKFEFEEKVKEMERLLDQGTAKVETENAERTYTLILLEKEKGVNHG